MANNIPQLQIDIFTFPGSNLAEPLAVRNAFEEALKQRAFHELGPLDIRLIGWRGIEGRDVILEVKQDHDSSLYELVTPDMVPRIIQSHLEEQRPIQRWLAGKDLEAFYEHQKPLVSELVGRLNPQSLEEYQDYDGYKGLLAYYSQGFDSFLVKVVAAGFCEFTRTDSLPLGTRWCRIRDEEERPLLVVHAAPPSPYATADEFLLEGVPHQVLEGILLGAETLKARAVLVYLPAGSELAVTRLREAWQALLTSRLLPAGRPSFDLEIVTGDTRVLIEDEALLESVLRNLLPQTFWQKFPQTSFLFLSLGTIASLPFVAQQPVSWFRQMGTECAPGTMLFRLLGAVEKPGFVEVPLTVSLGDLVQVIGGGVRHGRTLKAVQVGGPLGGIFPLSLLNISLNHETLRELGGSLALGLVQVLDERDCLVSLVKNQVAFIAKQLEALSPSCFAALTHIDKLLGQINDGDATPETLKELQSCCENLKNRGNSQLARQAVNPLLTSLHYFPGEYRMHLENKNCPAGVCPKLRLAPCHLACPAGIDIPSYLSLLAQGRYQGALEVILQDNPFPWVCGLICPHPCERACVRANLDSPINIRYLKAFVAEYAMKNADYPLPQPAPANGHQVAIVGSGPAGLTCAYYLALKGYGVTVFEALPEAGGLLVAGIPEYRLPREIIKKEIDRIRALGVEIKTGVTIGRDPSLEELRRQGYGAIFLGIGAHLGYKLKIEGEHDFPQVYEVVDFLRRVNLGEKKKPADKVVIVGGGNAAMDAARTCVRLGCKEVHISYRRTAKEMPAHPEEVEQAVQEGVQIHFLTVPIKVGGKNGKVAYLECLQAELGRPDASGRRRPIAIPGSNYRIDADAVITAIGQQPDLCPFPEPPVQTSPWCSIITEPGSTRTSVPDIFAGGDAVTGPATVVAAIAAGKQGALDIDHYLTGQTGPAPLFSPQKRRKLSFVAIPAAEKVAMHRARMPLLPLESRTRSFDLVELGLSEALAQKEASRCLRCDICIRCGTCESVCRDVMQVYALKFSQISPTQRLLSDYDRAQERCIACGACAYVCPTQAIDYLETETSREVRLCGTILNHLEVPPCKACGGPTVPARYLGYVTSKSDTPMDKHVLRRYCPRCARETRAREFVKL